MPLNDTKELDTTKTEEEVSTADVAEQVTEVQQELPLEQKQDVVVTTEESPEVKEANVAAPVETDITSPAIETVKQETVNDTAPVAKSVEVAETVIATQEDKVVAPKPAKKASSAVKKAAPKDKKLARQVKKANRLSGHAKAPMTKTETITTIKDIPTSFMADSERHVHQSSGRTAIIADVVNRSSAQATKP